MVSPKKVVCPWCVYNSHGCPVDQCDFRTLPMEKDAILKRMGQELNIINSNKRALVSGKVADPKNAVVGILDRVKGLDIMFNVLWKKFGMSEAEVKAQLPEVEKFSAADRLKLAIRYKSLDRGGK